MLGTQHFGPIPNTFGTCPIFYHVAKMNDPNAVAKYGQNYGTRQQSPSSPPRSFLLYSLSGYWLLAFFSTVYLLRTGTKSGRLHSHLHKKWGILIPCSSLSGYRYLQTMGRSNTFSGADNRPNSWFSRLLIVHVIIGTTVYRTGPPIAAALKYHSSGVVHHRGETRYRKTRTTGIQNVR